MVKILVTEKSSLFRQLKETRKAVFIHDTIAGIPYETPDGTEAYQIEVTNGQAAVILGESGCALLSPDKISLVNYNNGIRKEYTAVTHKVVSAPDGSDYNDKKAWPKDKLTDRATLLGIDVALIKSRAEMVAAIEAVEKLNKD